MPAKSKSKWSSFRSWSGTVYEHGPSSCLATVFASPPTRADRHNVSWVVNSWGKKVVPLRGTTRTVMEAKRKALQAQEACLRLAARK